MTTLTLQERITQLVDLYGSLRAVAAVLEIDVGYLSRLSSGTKTSPSADVLQKLDLRRVVSYERLTPNTRTFKATPLAARTKSG